MLGCRSVLSTVPSWDTYQKEVVAALFRVE